MLQGSQLLTVGEACSLACTLEATAPKAGNVYPGKAFDNLSILDFLAAASVCGHVLSNAGEQPVGRLVWQLVHRSRGVTQSNANLGIALILAPLAKAACANEADRSIEYLRVQTGKVLNQLEGEDGRWVYEAIRTASAGGLGSVESLDVREPQPQVDLMAAMQSAADRDQIANLYATGFRDLFDVVVPRLREAIVCQKDLLRGITHGQIILLSEQPDSLIARKCGHLVANDVRQRADQCRHNGGVHCEDSHWIEFDTWLRADGNRRNPGTTADLIAGGLFVLLRSSFER
ncbi:MAG: triphosphoribosyl-dephospho-CoA synthase [Pirellulaceae bacterium]